MNRKPARPRLKRLARITDTSGASTDVVALEPSWATGPYKEEGLPLAEDASGRVVVHVPIEHMFKYFQAAQQPAKAGRAAAQKRRTEADYHRQEATKVRAPRSIRFIAREIAAKCNSEGRKCNARTIERHLQGLRLPQ